MGTVEDTDDGTAHKISAPLPFFLPRDSFLLTHMSPCCAGGKAARNAWLTKVKRLLITRSAELISESGWRRLFLSFDRDGSGR
eukprot:COSAG04_NODE_618_length_11896_cov_81.925659_24_plen_83_part_00